MEQEQEMTAEYANGYMAGVDAERKRIVDLINYEIEARPKPTPTPVEHWTSYLLKLIEVDGKSRDEILSEIAHEVVAKMLKNLEERDTD